MKKASLNLSINAIVILILAITMLGLGLTFMKTMFGKVTTQFGDISSEIQNEMIKNLETSSSRLEFNKYLVEAKRGDDKLVYYGIYNNLQTDKTFQIQTKCSDAIGDGAPEDILLTTFNAQILEQNKPKVSPLKIAVDSNTIADTYACYLKVVYGIVDLHNVPQNVTYAEKEFTIRVS